MGELLYLRALDTMNDSELITYYRLAESNAERSIEYIRFVGGVMQGRAKYDDFHDVFPDDPA